MQTHTFTEHLRLTVLRMLAGAPAYTANSSMIHGVCGEFGFGVSRDLVKTEIGWLAEQHLVATRDLDGLIVATLTDRGLDVAEGRAVVPGVQRPSPR